jgi:LuxR family maltose regulon positive regulatory protein
MGRTLDLPLTLVSAPAGYGKSVLVRQWAKQLEQPCGWVSLDENDSDITVFLGYFLVAIDSLFPGACRSTQALVEAPELPPIQTVHGHLSNELDGIETNYAIVLDDYHRIDSSSPVHELLGRLLEHPPQSLHLVLITRRDPPLPLLRLRARAQVNEVRLRDLRFSGTETTDLLATASKVRVSEDALANLQHETEGWAVGLHLVLLAMRHIDNPDSFLKNLRGGIHHTQEYLLSEVMAVQPPDVRDCLLKTSILDRFCPQIFDALIAADGASTLPGLGGREFLDFLLKENLFVISLDAGGKWYRYHHLFQELLKERLKQHHTTSEISSLHMRAGAWFEGQGLIEEAIGHALTAGEIESAADIVEKFRSEVLDQERNGSTLAKWLERLPPEVKQRRAGLLVAEAWVASYQHRLTDLPLLMERARKLQAEAKFDPAVSGEIELLTGYPILWMSGKPAEALGFFEKALELIPPSATSFARADTELQVAIARYMAGDKDASMAGLHQVINTQIPSGGVRWSQLVYAVAAIHMLSGDLEQASQVSRRLKKEMTRVHDHYGGAWASFFIGAAAFRRFDLQEAQRHFSLAAKARYNLHVRAAIDSLCMLVITNEFLGLSDEANLTLQQAREHAEWSNNPCNLAIVCSCEARLALLRGDIDGARRLTFSLKAEHHVPSMIFYLEHPCITECRVLIRVGSEPSVREATEKLKHLREGTDALHFTCQTIEITVLLSLALHCLGQDDEAATTLEEALTLAWPGGWLSPFVEAGPAMTDLLRHLPEQVAGSTFVEHIVSAFGRCKEKTAPVAKTRQVSSPSFEPLTNREHEILGLLLKRLRDKEIAAELFISTQTVNSHLKNIYQKLGVRNRRQAAAKAVEMRIVNPPGRG